MVNTYLNENMYTLKPRKNQIMKTNLDRFRKVKYSINEIPEILEGLSLICQISDNLLFISGNRLIQNSESKLSDLSLVYQIDLNLVVDEIRGYASYGAGGIFFNDSVYLFGGISTKICKKFLLESKE